MVAEEVVGSFTAELRRSGRGWSVVVRRGGETVADHAGGEVSMRCTYASLIEGLQLALGAA
jgi:hypothetical protein